MVIMSSLYEHLYLTYRIVLRGKYGVIRYPYLNKPNHNCQQVAVTERFTKKEVWIMIMSLRIWINYLLAVYNKLPRIAASLVRELLGMSNTIWYQQQVLPGFSESADFFFKGVLIVQWYVCYV